MSRFVNIDLGAQNRWKVTISKHKLFARFESIKGCSSEITVWHGGGRDFGDIGRSVVVSYSLLLLWLWLQQPITTALTSWHEQNIHPWSRPSDVEEMRIGFLRRKNTDLPLFNGRRNGTRPSSPHRNIPSRKHVLLGLAIVATVLLLFNATSSSESKVIIRVG